MRRSTAISRPTAYKGAVPSGAWVRREHVFCGRGRSGFPGIDELAGSTAAVEGQDEAATTNAA